MAATGSERAADSLLIRGIAPEDAAAVAELSAQLGYDISPEGVAKRIRALTTSPRGQAAFVACMGPEVVGWVEVVVEHHLQSPPYGMITGLVVRDGKRSLGIGRHLCAEAESWCRTNRVSLLWVSSRMTRERAHRFYRREGFKQIKTSAVFEKVLL